MESDPYLAGLLLEVLFHPFTPSIIFGFVVFLVLILFSALVSGSEVAFFSLSPKQLNLLNEDDSSAAKHILTLLLLPEKLLATILIANNFINVGIVILSSYLLNELVDFSQTVLLGLIIQVGVVTFLLLLFGEIVPKVYAAHASLKFAKKMAYILTIASKILSPISLVLVKSTSLVNRRFNKIQKNISVEDLSQALEIAKSDIKENKDILESIISFGNTDVTEIMRPRMDVVAVGQEFSMNKLISVIIESGYSRIPVYAEMLDNIVGILYIKDLLPYIEEKEFDWKKLIRPPYFIPESRKINDLLKDFQKDKIHIALIADEYGGLQGVVTLEDILEEIVGEISDDSDDEEEIYTQLAKGTYLFEAKTQISEFYKIIDLQEDIFEKIRGEADSLGGLLLEIKGEIPQKGEIIEIGNYTFKVEAADKRRIKKIKITIRNPKN